MPITFDSCWNKKILYMLFPAWSKVIASTWEIYTIYAENASTQNTF